MLGSHVEQKADPNLLKIIRIDRASLYHKLNKKLVLAEYYYFNKEYEQSLKYLNQIMNGDNELLTLKAKANEILNKISKENINTVR